jgi:hypothetical protein
MSFPGYVKPTQAMVDAGVLYLRDTTTLVGVGATRGGLTFSPGREMRNIEFDGKTTAIEGGDRVLRYEATISGSMIDFSAKSLSYYEPGSTATTQGTAPATVTRISPLGATTFLTANAYLKDVMWISRNQDNSITVVGFPSGLVTEFEIASEQDSEAVANITIAARIPATATDINVAPYRIFKAPSLSALDALLPNFWDIAGYGVTPPE